MTARAGVVLVLGLALAACKRDPIAKSGEALPPLAGDAITKLAVPGHGDAVVSAPTGATRAKPVVVAVLGIADTPEGQCASWREIVDGHAFVLCPRGVPNVIQAEGAQRDEGDPATSRAAREELAVKSAMVASAPKVSGFYPPDVATLESEVADGDRALRARFGRYVAEGPMVFAGFSRGAVLGASLVADHPDRFPRAVFIEGGHGAWTPERAAAFARGGGKRVLFACGQPSCVTEANAAAKILTESGVETRVVRGEGERHGYSQGVKDEVRRAFDWVVEGDPRFRQMMASK